MRGESLRILFRGRKGPVTDTVGFLKKRMARLAREQEGVEEVRDTRRVVTSAYGRGLAFESCAREEAELGFLSGHEDLPKTSLRYLGSEPNSAGWCEDTLVTEQT